MSSLSASNTAIAAELRLIPYQFSTKCTTVDAPDENHKDQHGSSSVPIYQSATFKGLPGARYDYTRTGNPTRTYLQEHVAKISSCKHAFAVATGMSALDVILRTLSAGDEIIAGDDLYGGSDRLLRHIRIHERIVTHQIKLTDPKNFRPLLNREDSREGAEPIVVVDNTMMSPYLQLPLELGADIVYDSATKYLSGHHDLMAGLICCNRDDLAEDIFNIINSVGNGLAPQECWLLLRGIKTMAVRMDRQQESTQIIAEWLKGQGFKVLYPGLHRHPGRALHKRQARGAGAVLSFETGDIALSERIVKATKLWGVSVSFGCVNSLISMPCKMSHASIDAKTRKERNLPEDLIRLCVGIEDPQDLINDLQAALLEAGAIGKGVRKVKGTISKAKLQAGTIGKGVRSSGGMTKAEIDDSGDASTPVRSRYQHRHSRSFAW